MTLPALVAALQAVEAVVPGVCPLNMPPLPGLDRGCVAFMGDVAQIKAGIFSFSPAKIPALG